jgi:hypothetical protein
MQAGVQVDETGIIVDTSVSCRCREPLRGASPSFGLASPEGSGLRAVCHTSVPNLRDAYELRCLGASNVKPCESEHTQSSISRQRRSQQTSVAARTAAEHSEGGDVSDRQDIRRLAPKPFKKLADDNRFCRTVAIRTLS